MVNTRKKMIKRTLFVKQIRACSGLYYKIIKTRNILPDENTRMGHTLTEKELGDCYLIRGWEVEIT